MPVYKDKVPAKSGKCWYFRTRYKRLDGSRAQYHSKRYMTKREAQEAEAEFLIKSQNEASVSAITFNQLIDLFIENRSTRVKDTTMYGYKNKRPYLEPIANVKLKDFNIDVYERWRRYISSCNISTRYKNDIYKFLKSLLNYATDWYGFSFVHVYRKMHNFNNPNELPKEMLYFTYDEFQKFLSVEKDIKFRCAWQLLYYCGLRIGELKGITWKDIDFSFQLNYQFGRKVYGSHLRYDEQIGGSYGENFTEYVYKNRWQKPGDVTDVPQLVAFGESGKHSSRYLMNGNFVKLRNITLGYTLPTELTSKAYISRLRVYVQADNLLTWAASNYRGFDPSSVGADGVQWWNFPQSRNIVFGANVSF